MERILRKGLTRVWAHNLSRVGLRSIVFSSLRGAGSRGGETRNFTNSIKTLGETSTPVTTRVYVSTRTISQTGNYWDWRWWVVSDSSIVFFCISHIPVTKPVHFMALHWGNTHYAFVFIGVHFSCRSRVVEVERNLLASFSSSLPLGPSPSSPFKYSGRTGGWRRAIAYSAALVVGLLCFLLLPAVGCPLLDAMISECCSNALLRSRTLWLRSAASALYVTQMHSEVRPAPSLECQANKCESNLPPILPSSNNSLHQMVSNVHFSPIALLCIRLTCCGFLAEGQELVTACHLSVDTPPQHATPSTLMVGQ